LKREIIDSTGFSGTFQDIAVADEKYFNHNFISLHKPSNLDISSFPAFFSFFYSKFTQIYSSDFGKLPLSWEYSGIHILSWSSPHNIFRPAPGQADVPPGFFGLQNPNRFLLSSKTR
jgi:hypothetical protein